MQDIIIEEKVEKIVVEQPMVSSCNNVIDTPEFQKKMKDFDYKVEGEDIIVTGLKFEKTTVKIPIGVTKIGKDAFSINNQKSKRFKNIVLSKTVYEIEDNAFYQNYFIESIDMSSSSVLKIGKAAFSGCKYLKTVIFSPCLNEIGFHSFDRWNPTHSMKVIVPKHTKLDNDVFDSKTIVEYGCESEAMNRIEEYYLKPLENLKEEYENKKLLIKEECDRNLNCSKIEQKKNQKEVLNDLRKEKKSLEKELEKVKEKLKEKESKIIDIKYNDDEIMTFNKKINILFKNIKGIKKLILNDISQISLSKIKKFINLEVVQFNQFSSDLEIGEFCFSSNKKIKGVKIQANGHNVYVGHDAFLWCENLEYFDFSDVVSVGSLAFCGCEKLKNVRSNKLKEIGNYAFSHCKNIEELDLSEVLGKLNIDKDAFSDCPKLKEILLNSDSNIDSDYTFASKNDGR